MSEEKGVKMLSGVAVGLVCVTIIAQCLIITHHLAAALLKR